MAFPSVATAPPQWDASWETFMGLTDLSHAPLEARAEDLYDDLDMAPNVPHWNDIHLLDPVEPISLDLDFEEGEVLDEEEDDLDVAMENLQDLQEGTAEGDTQEMVTRVTLVEKGRTHFEILPEGWKKLWHESGMPAYYHAKSGTGSLGRPFEVKSASAMRFHRIPVSAVPCLAYQRALDEEKAAKQTDGDTLPDGKVIAEVMSGHEYLETALLTSDDLRTYGSQRFVFESTQTLSTRSRSANRRIDHLSKQLQIDSTTHPVIKGAQYVTIVRPPMDGQPAVKLAISVANKSIIGLLHEFTQQSRKCLPEYVFREVSGTGEGHEVTVLVQGKEEGFGAGASKKEAKQKAAEMVLMSLAPELMGVVQGKKGKTLQMRIEEEVELFRDVPIMDTRIGQMAHAAGATSPFQALIRACSQLHCKNVKLGKAGPIQTCRQLSTTENEYTMTAADFTAVVVHHNAVTAKMLNAQRILSQIHPELQFYGEFLERYGASLKKRQEEKMEERTRIVELQVPTCGQPNWEVINKLREEMRKIIPGGNICPSIRYE